jgi:hypothetical protein
MHRMFRPHALALATALLAVAATAQANSYTFSGNATHHNDVVQIDFTLTSAAVELRIWTDSWLSGLNFDPTAALWRSTGSDFTLLQAVDDDDTVGPGQGYYDAGFHLASLAAGQYRVTLAAAINAPLGTLLSQGFAYDDEAPIPIALWNQPSYDPNANDQKGTFWRINLAPVDAAAVVPEPASWLLMLGGVAALALRRTVR